MSGILCVECGVITATCGGKLWAFAGQIRYCHHANILAPEQEVNSMRGQCRSNQSRAAVIGVAFGGHIRAAQTDRGTRSGPGHASERS